MKIKRTIHGKEMEIELTENELYLAYEGYEHHCDFEYVKYSLSGDGLPEKFAHLSDEQWEDACHQIAYEKRRQQDKYGYDENDALDIAKAWFINTVLPDWPQKRYFQIRLANAGENNALCHVATAYCWSFDTPCKKASSEFAVRVVNQAFDAVLDITEIPREEVDEWFDDPAEIPALAEVGKATPENNNETPVVNDEAEENEPFGDNDFLSKAGDSIYNAVFEAIKALCPVEIEWDMNLIGDVTERIETAMCARFIPVCYPWEDADQNICYSTNERCLHCTRCNEQDHGQHERVEVMV